MASGHGGQDQHDGCGVVVDDHGSLGTGDAADQLFDVVITGAASTLFDVILQIGVASGSGIGSLGRTLGQNGTTQVGMQNNAGGIDDFMEMGGIDGLQLLFDSSADSLHRNITVAARQQGLTHGVDLLAGTLGDHILAVSCPQIFQTGDQLVDLGQVSQFALVIHFISSFSCGGSLFTACGQAKKTRRLFSRINMSIVYFLPMGKGIFCIHPSGLSIGGMEIWL